MADDIVKEVKLEFTGDIGKLKRAMKEAAGFQKDMGRTSKVMRKEGLRGYKDMAKATALVSKHDRGRLGKNALKHERDLQRQIKVTAASLRDLAKSHKSNSSAINEEYQQLKRLTSQMQKVRATRRSMGITTGRERAGAMGRSAYAKSGAFLSEVGGALTTALTSLVTAGLGAAMGIITSQVQAAYQQRVQYGQSYGQLAGLAGPGQGRHSLRRTQGAHLGYAPSEMAGIAGGVARATGRLGGADLGTAMQFQRGTGMEAAPIMAMLRQSTQKGGPGRIRSDMIRIMAAGMETGLERARMPEFFQGVQQMLQQQMSVQAGDVSPLQLTKFLAQMQATGQAGLMGARGAALGGRIHQGIQRPGGGDAGQALALQAFGFGKPGGTATYTEALLQQEQGATAKNVKAVLGEVQRQYGGGEAGMLALKEIFGISLTQAKAMQEMVEAGRSDAEIDSALATQGGDFGANKQMQLLGDTTRHLAQLSNRLVTMGDQFKGPIERIQDDINRVVAENTGLIVSALDTVADGVHKTVELLDRAFGETDYSPSTPDILEGTKELMAQAQEDASVAAENLARRVSGANAYITGELLSTALRGLGMNEAAAAIEERTAAAGRAMRGETDVQTRAERMREIRRDRPTENTHLSGGAGDHIRGTEEGSTTVNVTVAPPTEGAVEGARPATDGGPQDR